MSIRWATFIAVGAIDLTFGAIGMWFVISFAEGMTAFENAGSTNTSAVDTVVIGAAILAGIVVAGGIFVAAVRASNGDRPGLLPLTSMTLLAAAHVIGALFFTEAMFEDFPDAWSIAIAAYFVATSALILWLLIPLAADDQNWSSRKTT